MKDIYYIFVWMLLFWVSFTAVSARADLSRSKIQKGIKSYEQEQWDESLQHFQDALLDDPEHPVGHYNVGESQYKKKNYEEALKSYEKALNTDNIALREKIYYNLGNTYYQLNKYQEAIQSYIKALELDPDDLDAKHNLELVRAKLKEMAQKQPMDNQQQQQQQQQQSGDQQQEQQQANNQEQQDQQEQQQNQQQQEEQQGKENKQEDQKSAQPVEKQKELTKEEAERILQALKSEEKENQKLRQVQRPSGRAPVEKDW